MAISSVKSVSEEAKELIAQRKKEILEKIKNGETEVSIAVGGSSFTETEWDKLINRIDKSLESTKEEQKERFSKRKEELEEQEEENEIIDEKQLKEEFYEKEVVESKRKAARLLKENTEIKHNPIYKLQNY